MESIITINEHSKIPKYKQIINSIIAGVEKELLKMNDQLPSVNSLFIKFDISRDTVVKAYGYLKSIGIVHSVPGKGYYINNTNFQLKTKVFLLFNNLCLYNKIIYDSFSNMLGSQATIDIFIYNNDLQLFKNAILSHKDQNYTHFVIIPHFLEDGEQAAEFINQLPKHKLILLDKDLKGIQEEYASVNQDFEQDIYKVLVQALDLLKKYKRLKIIFPPDNYHPKETLSGFKRFCTEFGFEYATVHNIATEPIEKNEVYIDLKEGDLVTLIKRVKGMGLKVGQEIGIISYNEAPLKEILLDGITVISTDFQQLGETAARLVLNNEKMQITNPFRMIVRNSL